MAIVKVPRARKRHVWRVRWIKADGKFGSRSFDRKRDAEAFEAEVVRAKRIGTLGHLDRGRTTLHDFARRWWQDYVDIHLSPKTKVEYKRYLDNYVVPSLGTTPLMHLDTSRVARFQRELLDGGVGQESVRKTVAMLQGMLQRAVEWGYLVVNPAKAVKKLPQGRKRLIRPVAPRVVETMRAQLLAKGRDRDAALLSTLAYAGLRPGEALALRWSDVGGKTLTVDKAISLGQEKATKTRANRTVRLLGPLREDLEAWRKESGAVEGGLVFPTSAGTPWSDVDWRNWSRRIYRPLAEGVGLESPRPYDLRHSFASLLFQEQKMGHAQIASQLGHNVQTLFDSYTHVIEELQGSRSKSAERLIWAARDAAGQTPSAATKRGARRAA